MDSNLPITEHHQTGVLTHCTAVDGQYDNIWHRKMNACCIHACYINLSVLNLDNQTWQCSETSACTLYRFQFMSSISRLQVLFVFSIGFSLCLVLVGHKPIVYVWYQK